jgi:polyferredoxin
MKLFWLSFSLVLLILGFMLLSDPVHYSHRHGPQEAYQSIPAGILCIVCAVAFIISCKPHKTLRFPKTEEEKKRRKVRLYWTLGAYLGISLLYTFIIPGGYDSPPGLVDLFAIPKTAAISFVIFGVFFIPVSIFAYLLNEN